MKQLFIVLIFSYLSFKVCAQTSVFGVMIRFPCDTCASNHNPLAYSGGNIVSADIVDSPDGKYLKLVSSSSIDSNAIPAYFDIYSLLIDFAIQDTCASFRSRDISIDMSNGGQFSIILTSSIDNVGYKAWLASIFSSGAPVAGESTFQTNPLNINSAYILEGVVQTFGGSIFSMDINTPVWKDWPGNSKVNMFGFTALSPNTEYNIWQVNIGITNSMRLAAYDCSLNMAVKDANLKDKAKIYPLPASDFINIELPDLNEKYYVQIISNSGEVEYQNYHDGNVSIPLSNIDNGSYLMKISVGESYFTQKIVKE